MKTYSNLETQRLLIRPTTIDDAPFLYELMNSPKWIQFIGDLKMDTVEKVKDYIKEKILPQFTKLGFTNNTLILKETNEKIGICGLYCRDNGLDELELGFALLPQFKQKGLAYEANRELIAFGFDTLNIKTIKAITDKNNISCQNLLNRLGFIIKESLEKDFVFEKTQKKSSI